MTEITILPNEIIHIILQQEIIGIKDVVNFSLTCRGFLNVIGYNNKLWQTKLYQRWPLMKKIYDKRIQNKECINFKDEVKASIKCRNELRSYLSLMSKKFFHKQIFNNDIKDFDILFRSNMGAHIMNYYFLKDEMINLIAMYPLSYKCNLTHKYYSKEYLLPYLQWCYTKDIWQEFINCPKEKQLLEKAATIVAEWYQPQKFIFYFDVEASLDNIAQQVLEHLKKAHCEHPIFLKSTEQFSYWKCNNINDNQWNKEEERQIINMLQMVLYDELNFSGVFFEEYNYECKDVILIDHVLQHKIGDVVSLAIIFQSVARRLGVRCDLISFPTHFFLRWKPKSITKNEDKEYFYIDILHGGAILGKNDCPRTRGRCPIKSFNKPNEISPKEIVLRILNNLQMISERDSPLKIYSFMEFQHIIEPYNLDVIEELGHYYVQNQINLSGLLTTLKRIQDNCSSEMYMEKIRANNLLWEYKMKNKMYMHSVTYHRPPINSRSRYRIKYAIGMIMTCRKVHPNYTGVIIAWNEIYNSRFTRDSPYLEQSITINTTVIPSSEMLQPFYYILSEDGNKYYAPEDSLEICPPRLIEHNEIGRYFCRFTGFYYVPNEMLRKQYMDDEQFLRKFHKTQIMETRKKKKDRNGVKSSESAITVRTACTDKSHEQAAKKDPVGYIGKGKSPVV